MQTLLFVALALGQTTTPEVVVHAAPELRMGITGELDPTRPQRLGRSHLEAELERRLAEVRAVHEPQPDSRPAASELAWKPEVTWGRDPTDPPPEAPMPGRSFADRALSDGLSELKREHREATTPPESAPQQAR